MANSMNKKGKSEEPNRNVPDQGVFVTKGMKISIQKFSLRLGIKGDVKSDPVILHTGIDLCPYIIIEINNI